MQHDGVVQSGSYAGQRYNIVKSGIFPDWFLCEVEDERDERIWIAEREIRAEHIEQ